MSETKTICDGSYTRPWAIMIASGLDEQIVQSYWLPDENGKPFMFRCQICGKVCRTHGGEQIAKHSNN